MTAFVALLLLSTGWTSPRDVVFGDGKSWVLWEVQEARATPFSFPDGFAAHQAAATRSGATIFFIGETPTGGGTAVYRWDRLTTEPPKMIGNSRGYHGDLSLSDDERWLYTTFHEHGAPPGAHPAGAYQQLHRVSVDGRLDTQLTTSDGCKLGSSPIRGTTKLLVVHANCNGASSLETVDSVTKQFALAASENGRFRSVSSAPDGKTALLVTSSLQGVVVLEWSADDGKLSWVATLGFEPASQVTYGRTRNEILYWNGHEVKSLQTTSKEASPRGGTP